MFIKFHEYARKIIYIIYHTKRAMSYRSTETRFSGLGCVIVANDQFCMYTSCSRIMLRVAMETTRFFFHSANKFILKNKNSLHFLSPNEQCCNDVNFKKEN